MCTGDSVWSPSISHTDLTFIHRINLVVWYAWCATLFSGRENVCHVGYFRSFDIIVWAYDFRYSHCLIVLLSTQGMFGVFQHIIACLTYVVKHFIVNSRVGSVWTVYLNQVMALAPNCSWCVPIRTTVTGVAKPVFIPTAVWVFCNVVCMLYKMPSGQNAVSLACLLLSPWALTTMYEPESQNTHLHRKVLCYIIMAKGICVFSIVCAPVYGMDIIRVLALIEQELCMYNVSLYNEHHTHVFTFIL